jgi:FkbM family methyltransferase
MKINLKKYEIWLKRALLKTLNYLPPIIVKRKYCHYTLFYSLGTSIVNEISKGGFYERPLIERIQRELSSKNLSKVFIDVGANIGLISLQVLRICPELKIFAFEPGKVQYELLHKTVIENSLQNKINIFNKALSNKSGHSEFIVHGSCHVSGDGFIDTGRAGHSRKRIVEKTTLDLWWKQQGKPAIGIIKIDTEGAELWVLEGGIELINTCKPVLFLEICFANICAYNIKPETIANWLTQNNYRLETLEGQYFESHEIASALSANINYVAVPNV